ncbi:MAG: P-loop NTPase [Desulfosarcinaceae bacterium]|nr:P-loop NTPase [Desulfosarcinaceae bacterium]
MGTPPFTMCITSGKGGVGKTSLAVNLGAALTRTDRKVLIVDGDLGLANVDIFFGLSVDTNILDILANGSDPLACVSFPLDNLGVLPATSGVPEMVALGPGDQDKLGGYLQCLFDHFDLVLIDTAAGIGASVLWFNSFVGDNLVVLTPEPTAITDAYALVKVLSTEHRRHRFEIVVNQVADTEEGARVFHQFQMVAGSFLDVDLNHLGTVVSDPLVGKAVRRQKPFVLASHFGPAAQAVRRIAADLDPRVVTAAASV